MRYLPEVGGERGRRGQQPGYLAGRHGARVIKRGDDLVAGGEGTGLVPAGAFGADVAFEGQRDVGQQVAEDRQRGEGPAEHGRGLGGRQPGEIGGPGLDRVPPLVPAPLGQFE